MAYYFAVVKKRGSGYPLKVTFAFGKGTDPLPGETNGAIMEMCKAAGVKDTSDFEDFQLMAIHPGQPQYYTLLAEKPQPKGGTKKEKLVVPEEELYPAPQQKALVTTAIVSTDEADYSYYERAAA